LTPAAANDRVRIAFCALLLIAAFAAVLASAGPAGAAKSCGRAVIDDWYEDGRVDGTYQLHCYDDAIDNLPRDVRDYSSAKEDIQRALQARQRGEDAPPARTDPTPGGGSGGAGGGPGGGSGTPGAETLPTDTTGANSGDEGSGGSGGGEASGPTDPDSASSVPIPLLILAGLALLLIACGSAGYLIRRLQARRPPTSAA